LLSLLVGSLKKNDIEQYKTFKLYTVDRENNVSDGVDRNILKKINILNEDFSKAYKEDFKINVLAEEGVNFKYRIRFTSRNEVSNQKMNQVYLDYTKMLKDNNIIFHISSLEDHNIVYTNIRLHTVTINIIQAILYIVLIVYLCKKVKLGGISEDKFLIISAIIFSISLIFNLFVALLAAGISYIIISNITRKYEKYKTTITRFVIAALAVRIAITILMLAYNYYKYRTFLSYSQTDEIFYYSTSDYIYQALVNFTWPNLYAITGIDQYGYNLFMGVVKFINHGDIFLSIKIINIAVSTVFVVLLFKFVYDITENYSIAKVSAIMMAVMPTFAVFTSFALRDILISINIFLILYEAILINKWKNKVFNSILCVFLVISLWYLRRYALLLTIMLIALYVVIRFFVRRKVNIIVILGVLLLLGGGLITVASKLYAFNIFNMLKSYIFSQGILSFLSGIILSLVNLDFLINSGTSLYTSVRSLVFRALYPETLFLIISFPIMCLGFVKALKKDIGLVITTLTMFVGFITIYKMQYGGWFLRTQLQIFPFQYMFISWGLVALIYESDSKLAKKIRKVIDMI
jgi:hypothetical protein